MTAHKRTPVVALDVAAFVEPACAVQRGEVVRPCWWQVQAP